EIVRRLLGDRGRLEAGAQLLQGVLDARGHRHRAFPSLSSLTLVQYRLIEPPSREATSCVHRPGFAAAHWRSCSPLRRAAPAPAPGGTGAPPTAAAATATAARTHAPRSASTRPPSTRARSGAASSRPARPSWPPAPPTAPATTPSSPRSNVWRPAD